MSWNLFLYNIPDSISKHWKMITDDIGGNAQHLPEEFNSHIGSVIISIIIGLLIFCVVWWAVHSKKSYKSIIHHLGWITSFVFIAGIILYWVGYWEGGLVGNVTGLLISSAISSFEMFFAQSDLDNIAGVCKESFVYMTFFAIIHFFAILVSVTFIIHLIGFRFISNWKLRNWKREKLYIFWGINDKSLLLAKDIKKTKGENESYHLVFVKTPKEEEISDKTEFSFYHLLNRASQDKNILNNLEDINALVTYSTSIDTLDKPKRETEERHIFDELELRSLYKAIKKSEEIHFFFFSDNEMENLTTMSILKEAMTTKEYDSLDVHYYCHARKNKRSISYTMPQNGKEQESKCQVHIVDSSDLAAMQLKQQVQYHPVAYMNVDTTKGVATKPFMALFMGFGETGRSVLKFIYEFASVLDNKGEKNLFHCDIYDPNMEEIRNGFYMRMPALKKTSEIDLMEGSDSSPLFWDDVESMAPTLDYIVVAINDDEKAIALAANLFEYIVGHRNAYPERFTIFVRVYHSENERHMKDIADYYNNNPVDGIHGEIVLFGKPEDLFTYRNIIDNQIEKKAKIYYYKYQLTQDGETTCQDVEQNWLARRAKEKKKVNGLEYFNAIQQKEAEDFSNVWHIDTKMWLMGVLSEQGINQQRLEELLEYSQKRDRAQHDVQNNYGYIEKDETGKDCTALQELIMNIAKTEHMRWVASMELLGYTWLPYPNAEHKDRDYSTKQHACLTDFDTIIKTPELCDTIKYDCSVTDTSLEITSKGWEQLYNNYNHEQN